jgi:hypothetical protein
MISGPGREPPGTSGKGTAMMGRGQSPKAVRRASLGLWRAIGALYDSAHERGGRRKFSPCRATRGKIQLARRGWHPVQLDTAQMASNADLIAINHKKRLQSRDGKIDELVKELDDLGYQRRA